MIDRLSSMLSGIARGMRAILGAPDYETYLRNHRDCGCDCKPLSTDEFYRERLDARYSKLGSRCC